MKHRLLTLALLSAFAMGCNKVYDTAIFLQVTSTLTIPDQLDNIRIRAVNSAETSMVIYDQFVSLAEPDRPKSFPLTMTITQGDESISSINISVWGYRKEASEMRLVTHEGRLEQIVFETDRVKPVVVELFPL